MSAAIWLQLVPKRDLQFIDLPYSSSNNFKIYITISVLIIIYNLLYMQLIIYLGVIEAEGTSNPCVI